MPDASYYRLIVQTDRGQFEGWIPDLPEVKAFGAIEDEVIRGLSRNLRKRLRRMQARGQPIPKARRADELPRGEHHGFRRLLLIVV